LAKAILSQERFYKFFDYVEMSTFDIASDAFTTFKVFSVKLMSFVTSSNWPFLY